MAAIKYLSMISGALLAGLICSASCNAAMFDDVELAKMQYFEAKVRPLLIESCIRCHGEEKQEGGLRLDSSEAFAKGGDSGQLLDPSDIENSLLLSAVHYRGIEMPPSGKMPVDKIQVFQNWVESGATWPAQAKELRASDGNTGFTEYDRAYWFFQNRETNVAQTNTDHPSQASIARQIDSMIETRLQDAGLAFAEPANKLSLARRAYLDLVGVSPTAQEANQFLADTSPEAYSKLVDQLLDDPRYGERWGRFWLDLVRYSESDGYKQDDFRPTAYRYRDYVIRSFNQDKSYTDFIREQLAGDELDPNSLECRDASGYLRLWIYEYNQRDVVGQWDAILNDLTDVTGEAILGLGYGCARCHDHKFDPLLQKDYYRLQAYFSGLIPREDLPAATPDEIARYLKDEKLWKDAAQPYIDTIESIEGPIRERTIRAAIEKFPPEVRPALSKSPAERSPREKQLAHLASLQQDRDVRELKWDKVIPTERLEEWRIAKEHLKQLPVPKLSPLPVAMAATDLGRDAAEVYVPGKRDLGQIQPGIPSILNSDPMPISPQEELNTTGRRLALANWIVQPENPLTWRVIVNRIWQQHFGTGIVSNASDFGRLTQPPTHPELLDFLANQFVNDGARFKNLHRWIMNSRAYQQSAYPQTLQSSLTVDPDNNWLWRFSPRRLDAEQIRDSILSVSGQLPPPVKDTTKGKTNSLRSIYVRAMRNSPDRFLALFDAPDGVGSVAKRNATTTPLQSLMMMNSDWMNAQAKKMALQIMAQKAEPEACLREAYERVFLKIPTQSDLDRAKEFLKLQEPATGDGWKTLFVDYCHVLINSNSFLYME